MKIILDIPPTNLKKYQNTILYDLKTLMCKYISKS